MTKQLTKAESEAVERHRARLSNARGCEVNFEEALDDWLSNCAQQWRQQRQAHMLAMEREEILRHKWIESEKHQHDVGAEAVFDWIRRYAAPWRKWFEEEYDGRCDR